METANNDQELESASVRPVDGLHFAGPSAIFALTSIGSAFLCPVISLLGKVAEVTTL